MGVLTAVLNNEGVRELLPLSGGLPEGVFSKWEEAVWLTPFGKVLHRPTIEGAGDTLAAAAEALEWPEGALQYATAAAVYFAFYSAIPVLDVQTTAAGFAVVQTQGLAPASAHRVVRLMRSVQKQGYAQLGALFESFWEGESSQHTGDKIVKGFQALPYRNTLANSVKGWGQGAGVLPLLESEAPIVSVEHAFFALPNIRAEVEQELIVPYMSEYVYKQAVAWHGWGGAGVELEPATLEEIRSVVYAESAARLKEQMGMRGGITLDRYRAQEGMIRLRKRWRIEGGNPIDPSELDFFLA